MKKTLLFAATALAMLASCSQSDDLNNAPVVAETNQAVEFGTYVGKTPVTRAGTAGSITTTSLKTGTHASSGFGVFAYYTGTAKYNDNSVYTLVKTDGTSGQSSKKANFMYNQQVTWTSGKTGYIGAEGDYAWAYAPLKYWPNEVRNGTVDDQTDAGAATTDYTQGGNLSFFAYAPYVNAAISETTKGIVAINGETTLAGGNVKSQDPILSYIVAPAGNEVVDLLWGTAGTASVNVVDGANTGVSYDAGGNNYAKSILPSYTLNADLTKQKTNGKVDFAFKHALAKVGGSTTGGGAANGLLIKLDLDNGKGALDGGDKEAATLVTINEIKIEARAKYDEDENSTLDADEYMKSLRGDFNLATGQWGIYTTSNFTTKDGTEAKTTHIINPAGTGTNVAGKLNEDIAENTISYSSGWKANGNSIAGVTTDAKNVYDTEASPLVYIPGTYPELTVTVDYIVRTYDANLDGNFSEVEQKITKTITFAEVVKLNKQYNLIIHLGLTGIKFTATVSDWDPDIDGDGVIEPAGDDKKDIYVPINVD